MTITVDRKKLVAGLRILLPALPKKSAIPLLNYVEIDMINGETLCLRANDLDMEITHVLSASGERMKALIPARSFLSRLSAMWDETVTIDLVADQRVQVSGTDSQTAFRLLTLADSFPGAEVPPDDCEAVATIEFAENQFHGLFGPVAPVISTEETRYYLNGVCLAHGDTAGEVRATATNGHQLESRTATVHLTGQIIGQPIVPRAAVAAMLATPKNIEMRFELLTSPPKGSHIAYARLTAGQTCVATKLIDGTFPDWQRVVPALSNNTIEVDAGAMVRALKIGTAGGSRHSCCVALIAQDGELIIRGRREDEEFESFVAASIGGVLASAAVNPFLLAPVLRAYTGKIKLHIIDDRSPVRITDGITKAITVVMPMRLPSDVSVWPALRGATPEPSKVKRAA